MNRPVLGGIAAAALAVASCGNGSQGALGQAHLSADCPSQDLDAAWRRGSMARSRWEPRPASTSSRRFRGRPRRRRGWSPAIPTFSPSKGKPCAASRTAASPCWSCWRTRTRWSTSFTSGSTAADRLALSVFTSDGRELGEVVTGAELLTGEDSGAGRKRLCARAEAAGGHSGGVRDRQRRRDAAARADVGTHPGGGAQAGQATVTVTAGGLATTLSVEVKP